MSPVSDKFCSRKKRVGKFLALDRIQEAAPLIVHNFSDK